MMSIIENTPFLKRTFTSLRDHLRIPLFANAYALMTNQVLAAGLGFLFWLMAARLYPVEVVGENSAIISTIIFMAALAELSLKSAMTRFVPRAGRNTPRLIGSVFGINLAVSFLVSLFLVTVGKQIPLTADLLETVDVPPFWLIVAAMSASIYLIQDGVMMGMRQSKWVLVKNITLNVSKLILLIVFFRVFSAYGIATSFFITAPVLVILFMFLIYFRFMPKHVAMDTGWAKPLTRREIFGSITGDHIGTILSETCIRLLPLVVLHLLGASFTAYYYQAWNITSTIYLLATAMTASFTVEASANMTQLVLNSRRILRQMVSLIVPVIAVLWLAAPLVLHLLGKNYAVESLGLMRWLLLATLPYMITAWYLSYSRVLAKAKTIILIQGVQLVVTLGASYFLLPRYGIIGVGIAWCLAHCAISVMALPVLIQVFFWKIGHTAEQASPSQVARRSDWRFLLPLEMAKKSVCFAEENLLKSVATFSEQVITRADSSVHDCDLAVAINPTSSVLQNACQMLGPDGVCYTEWAGWRKGGVWGIQRRLQKAGFSWAKFYFAAPSPVQPRVWAPLQSNHAPLRYIARQFFSSDSIIHWLGRIVIAGIAPVFIRMGIVPTLSIIAGKGATKERDVFDFIQKEWPTLCPNIPAEGLSYLVQTGGSLISSNVVYLIFAAPETNPCLVVKIPRDSACAVPLQHEQEVLMDLQDFNQGKPANSLVVPRFIPIPPLGSMGLYGQSALTGKSVGKLVGSGQFESIAGQITDALVSLARHSAKLPLPVSAETLADQLSARIANFSDSKLDPEDIARTCAILASLSKLPPVYVHNDFAVWNMVATPHGLGVFDWSDADRNGLPLLDLVYSLSGAVFLMENAHSAREREASYRRLLDPATQAGAIFQDCLSRYAREVDLDSSLIPSLRLATWVVHSLYERFEHQREFGPRTQPDESVCTPLWKVELQMQSSPQTSPLAHQEG